MRAVIKRYHTMRINRRLAANIRRIDQSRALGEAFTEREVLYMKHHELLEQRDRHA